MKLLKSMVIAALCTLAAEIQAQKYVGGDISCLTTNENAKAQYLDKDGKRISNTLDFFRQEKMNAMRVRLFVNPSDYSGSDKDANANQDLEYVKALGKRIKDAGMSLMLDFHYSDTWADPAKQWTPKAWENLDDEQLVQKIYDYTKDVLNQMIAAGAKPDLIQTGNEISYGMLWGKYGSAESSQKRCYTNSSSANWTRLTNLLKSAGKACREVCPDAKIILHTERTAQTNVQKNFYDKMKSAGVDYDIIGLSYYPIWHKDIATLETSLKDLEKNYPDKKIMIVEVGYGYSWQDSNAEFNYQGKYPLSETGQANFTKDLIAMLNKHTSVNGLFWWWMEYNAYPYDTTHMDGWWYAPLFNSNTGKAMPALYEMQNFLDGADFILSPVNDVATPTSWYTIGGKKVRKPTKNGIYIKDNKKIVVK